MRFSLCLNNASLSYWCLLWKTSPHCTYLVRHHTSLQFIESTNNKFLPLQFLHLAQHLYPCNAPACDLLWITPLLSLAVTQQGPQLSQPPLRPFWVVKRQHGSDGEGERVVERKADGDDSLWECFFLEVELQEGHNLCCRQFHPKGLCLLPSMYCVAVTPTLVQHQQWSLEQSFNGCCKAKSDPSRSHQN